MFPRFLPRAALLCAVSCSSHAFPPGLADLDGGPTGRAGAGGTAPIGDGCAGSGGSAPSPDAQGLCGNTFLDITSDPPNLYFVIDRSGSMGEIIEGHQKYDLVATAAVALVRSLGSQANVGAAVFPGRGVDATDQCVAGEEVFSAEPGDPARNGACGVDGPVTRGFSRAISLPSGVRPNGATPTAATLSALLPTVTALPGRTVVLLATDGGPNCNSKAACDATKCIANIEHQAGCSPDLNCCDPRALYGPNSCLDDDGTRSAVLALSAKGIKTYVVGIPGSSPYAALLNDLAVAGGTARTGMLTSYYDVEHVSELDDVLASIGATVTSSCHLHLAAPPPDSHLVNVYLDGQLVKFGENGWMWGDADASRQDVDARDDAMAIPDDADIDASAPAEAAIEVPPPAPHTQIDLVGASCDMLTSGRYRRVQVVFGCPTDIPR